MNGSVDAGGAGRPAAELTAQIKVLVVVPVYNHRPTLRRVVELALSNCPDVLVVDDGSTDGGAGALDGLAVRIVRHDSNRGKGAAILTAASVAASSGMTHIITLDADGQHDPLEIPLFVAEIRKTPHAILVGKRDFDAPNVPDSSRFGRRFGNFWFRVPTGLAIGDVQSGYRAYPVAIFPLLRLYDRRYSFEVEVLVRAAWAGVRIRDVDVSVFYPPREERISHFRAFLDNARITHLNAKLVARSFLPWPHRRMAFDPVDPSRATLMRMRDSIRAVLRESTPWDVALAGMLGTVIAALPILGAQGALTLFLAGYFRLNKPIALLANQLGMPPFIQALCVETGYFMRNGTLLTVFSVDALGHHAKERLLEWLIGSLVVGPILALPVGAIAYLLTRAAHGRLRNADASS